MLNEYHLVGDAVITTSSGDDDKEVATLSFSKGKIAGAEVTEDEFPEPAEWPGEVCINIFLIKNSLSDLSHNLYQGDVLDLEKLNQGLVSSRVAQLKIKVGEGKGREFFQQLHKKAKAPSFMKDLEKKKRERNVISKKLKEDLNGLGAHGPRLNRGHDVMVESSKKKGEEYHYRAYPARVWCEYTTKAGVPKGTVEVAFYGTNEIQTVSMSYVYSISEYHREVTLGRPWYGEEGILKITPVLGKQPLSNDWMRVLPWVVNGTRSYYKSGDKVQMEAEGLANHINPPSEYLVQYHEKGVAYKFGYDEDRFFLKAEEAELLANSSDDEVTSIILLINVLNVAMFHS